MLEREIRWSFWNVISSLFHFWFLLLRRFFRELFFRRIGAFWFFLICVWNWYFCNFFAKILLLDFSFLFTQNFPRLVGVKYFRDDMIRFWKIVLVVFLWVTYEYSHYRSTAVILIRLVHLVLPNLRTIFDKSDCDATNISSVVFSTKMWFIQNSNRIPHLWRSPLISIPSISSMSSILGVNRWYLGL